MKLPEDRALWDHLHRLAVYDLLNGVAPPRQSILICFPAERYASDISELGKDLVQKTRAVLDQQPEPMPPVKNWVGFLRRQVQGRILDVCKKELNNPSPESLAFRVRDSSGTLKWRDLEIPDTRPLPEERLICDEIREELSRKLMDMQSALLDAVRRHTLKLLACDKIRADQLRIDAFLEVVRMFIQKPWIRFDTHRQVLAASNANIPPKPTANSWWRLIRRDIPMMDRYVQAAKEINCDTSEQRL
jgi:hypothetical protein